MPEPKLLEDKAGLVTRGPTGLLPVDGGPA